MIHPFWKFLSVYHRVKHILTLQQYYSKVKILKRNKSIYRNRNLYANIYSGFIHAPHNLEIIPSVHR